MSLKSIFATLRNKPRETPVEMPIRDQEGEIIDDPILTSIVNEAFRTGEPVFWNEGDDLPSDKKNSG